MDLSFIRTAVDGRGAEGGKDVSDLAVDSLVSLTGTESGGTTEGETVVSSAREAGVLGLDLVVELILSPSELADGGVSTGMYVPCAPRFTWSRSW